MRHHPRDKFTNILMQLNFLILLYNSSTARKHLFSLLCTPSRPSACNVAHNGRVGKRLDNESHLSRLKPDTNDKGNVGRPPLLSVILYNVYGRTVKDRFTVLFGLNIQDPPCDSRLFLCLKGYDYWQGRYTEPDSERQCDTIGYHRRLKINNIESGVKSRSSRLITSLTHQVLCRIIQR